MRKLKQYVYQDGHVHQGQDPAGSDEKAQQGKLSTMAADKASVVVKKAQITSQSADTGSTI